LLCWGVGGWCFRGFVCVWFVFLLVGGGGGGVCGYFGFGFWGFFGLFFWVLFFFLILFLVLVCCDLGGCWVVFFLGVFFLSFFLGLWGGGGCVGGGGGLCFVCIKGELMFFFFFVFFGGERGFFGRMVIFHGEMFCMFFLWNVGGCARAHFCLLGGGGCSYDYLNPRKGLQTGMRTVKLT